MYAFSDRSSAEKDLHTSQHISLDDKNWGKEQEVCQKEKLQEGRKEDGKKERKKGMTSCLAQCAQVLYSHGHGFIEETLQVRFVCVCCECFQEDCSAVSDLAQCRGEEMRGG